MILPVQAAFGMEGGPCHKYSIGKGPDKHGCAGEKKRRCLKLMENHFPINTVS
jgi:hypothetical protein